MKSRSEDSEKSFLSSPFLSNSNGKLERVSVYVRLRPFLEDEYI